MRSRECHRHGSPSAEDRTCLVLMLCVLLAPTIKLCPLQFCACRAVLGNEVNVACNGFAWFACLHICSSRTLWQHGCSVTAPVHPHITCPISTDAQSLPYINLYGLYTQTIDLIFLPISCMMLCDDELMVHVSLATWPVPQHTVAYASHQPCQSRSAQVREVSKPVISGHAHVLRH